MYFLSNFTHEVEMKFFFNTTMTHLLYLVVHSSNNSPDKFKCAIPNVWTFICKLLLIQKNFTYWSTKKSITIFISYLSLLRYW